MTDPRAAAGAFDRLGRADLHIHTLASDGTSSVGETLDLVEADGFLDVIAIADHERIDSALAARAMAADRGLRVAVVVGEEISTRGGHLLALFLERPVAALKGLEWSIEAVHDQGGLAIPSHPLVPFPMCAQGRVLRRLLASDHPAVRPDTIETFNPTALGKYRHDTVVRFAEEFGLAELGSSDAHVATAVGSAWTTFPGRTPEDLRRAIVAGTTRHHGEFHGSVDQLGVYGRQLRKYATGWRATVGGKVRRDGTGRDLGYPGGAQRPARYDPAMDQEDGATVKIGLVSPYVYPLPGGVTQHVRYLYENLRLRGHEVRILTSSHGLQRSSEGDVIRLGKGFSMPSNGSVGTITLSPRYVSQARDLLEHERFDVLHFHEPFVPFLSLVLLGQSRSVNIGTFHAYGGWSPAYEFGRWAMGGYAGRLHGRIAVSAAARHFIDRYFPGDYKVIPNGVDVTRFQRAVPLTRWKDGTPNILFVGRFEPRKGVLDLLKAYRTLRRTGMNCRLLLVGGGPQEREARRYVATRRLVGVEFLGRVSDDEKVQLFRTCDVYCSPATGRESFGIVLLEAMAAGAPIVASDIHGYKGVVRRGTDALLVPPKDPRELAVALGRLLEDHELAAAISASGMARAEEYSWPRVTAKVDDYYGFVIRRLAATGSLPEHFTAEVPPSPRAIAAPQAAAAQEAVPAPEA